MIEIRQLFGLPVNGDDANGESGEEGEEDPLANQKLMDQIFKIKMII